MSTTPRALHPVLLMIILGSIQAVMPISIDLYLPSLPTIAREFAVSSGSVQFTLAIFYSEWASAKSSMVPSLTNTGVNAH